MQTGDKVLATKMAGDSCYQQVIGTVQYVRSGHVCIRAVQVMNKWDNKFLTHPSACLTSAKVEDVVILEEASKT